MRVIVIGAGLGGLALTHGLRAAGVDATVYERNAATGPQPASYGIHINGHGHRALHACLPTENWDLYDRAAVSAPDVVRFRDSTLRTLTDLELSSPADDADPVARRRAVRRHPLHRCLLHGLEDAVRWNKTFTSYTRRADGRIRVEFDDGTSTEGDLLVGADGSNSRVRHQYLPHLVRHDLGVVTVAGRVPLAHPAARALPHDMIDGSINNLVPRQPGWMFVSTWPGARDGEAGTRDDVLVWAYAATHDACPADVDTLDPAHLRAWVTGRVGGWDHRVADLVAGSTPDTVALVPLRSMSRLPAWRSSAITLLGDAIHTMSPMAGIGATTALRDADTLRRTLTDPTAAGLDERVGRYEHRMRTYANDALALSTRNARNAATERRLPRLAFRTLLTLTDKVPPLRHTVFPATARAVRRG